MKPHLSPRSNLGPSFPDGRSLRRAAPAFTLLEILLAIAIFSMVVTAAYASWSAILRAAKAGNDASAALQRSRIASRTVEDALVAAVLFAGNPALYAFEADTRGEFAALSFVARLPPSFPGSGYYGDQVMRRVTFQVESADEGGQQLVLRQTPILQAGPDESDEKTIVLARDVHMFMLEFCRQRGLASEWVEEWTQTNQLPKVVRFAMAFGKPTAAGNEPTEVTVRTVAIPSIAVPREAQQPRGGPGAPAAGAVPGQGVEGRPSPGGIANPDTGGSRSMRNRVGSSFRPTPGPGEGPP